MILTHLINEVVFFGRAHEIKDCSIIKSEIITNFPVMALTSFIVDTRNVMPDCFHFKTELFNGKVSKSDTWGYVTSCELVCYRGKETRLVYS